MKTGCIIYSDSVKYTDLHDCATRSFAKHHPDIELYSIDHLNHQSYLSHLGDAFGQAFTEYIPTFNSFSPGVRKYAISLHLAQAHGLDKVIILGSDTITCGRLDEFLDGTEDILATLDYPYQFDSLGVRSPDNETHVNADVVCFNNLKALEDVCNIATRHHVYHEQGALNEVLWQGNHSYTYRIVDHPYELSTVVYNARAKGNICDETGEKPWARYTNQFFVKDGKLFTGADKTPKQIKVWHYCDGFGTVGEDRMHQLIQWWKTVGFNQATREFFLNNCDCKFFN